MTFHIIRQIYQSCRWQGRKGGSVATLTYVSVLLFSPLFLQMSTGWNLKHQQNLETFILFDNLPVTFCCDTNTLYLPLKSSVLHNHSVVCSSKNKKKNISFILFFLLIERQGYQSTTPGRLQTACWKSIADFLNQKIIHKQKACLSYEWS